LYNVGPHPWSTVQVFDTPIEPGISLKIVAQVGLSALVPWDELHCHASQA